jgi:hypothetical protein
MIRLAGDRLPMSQVFEAAFASLAVLLSGVTITWLTIRRAASGKISTTEARVLWEQAQEMRAELIGQRDKAIEQRERLIESQASAIIPALEGLNKSLWQITESLARLEATGGQ